MRYIKRNNYITLVADWGSAHFDPSVDSEYTEAYLAWVALGNIAEEWSN